MGLFFYSMPVRALLKYEHCEIRPLCSRVRDNCFALASYFVVNSLKNVPRRKMKYEEKKKRGKVERSSQCLVVLCSDWLREAK